LPIIYSHKASSVLIEQAIFTSTQSIRLDGYQIAASSRGIDAADLRELSVWGPSHDSLLETGEDAVSINFHPLPSGAFCISKTTPAGSEYSGRSGHKIYTQCFVTPRSVLARFANNPFAVLNAAFAQGSLKVHDPLPEQLEPFRLAGKTSAVDRSLLGQLLAEPGPAWLSALVHAALTSTSLALVAGANSIRLISGLINCLPPECRTEFSFCTGLKHSPRRPFRILSLASDSNEQRRMLRQQQTTVLELGGEPPQQLIPTDGWSGFVAQCLASGNTEFLAQELTKPRTELAVSGLKQLGNELLEHLGAQATSGKIDPGAPGAEPIAVAAVEAPTNAAARPTDVPPPAAPKAAASIDDQRRADAAHRRFQRAAQALAQQAPVDELEPDPAQVLGSQCPAALEQLERLDDTVFEAIAGKPGALEQLRKLWPEVLAKLGPDLIEESREQYVRHALRVWRDCLEGDQIRNPALAVAAMDVVCLLFNE
jgi:hypothetical protein